MTSLREELFIDLEAARMGFHHLLDTIPESAYPDPSDNAAWTVQNILFHIALGPSAMKLEILMIRYAPWLMQLVLNPITSRLLHWGNAWFARQPQKVTRERLHQMYERGHTSLLTTLKRMTDDDLRRSVFYPPEFVSDLGGEVTIERLIRYVRGHLDVHAGQIRKGTG